ncbi:MAG: nucleoside deaminase [Actinobacteria bacterium]|nr:MAG: nucleoside deaminase [Actinomycetota bacterium]
MEKYMMTAYIEAKKAFAEEEVPVGAVIVCKGKIISKAYNQREVTQDPTAHAEILAIKEASKKLKSWRLNECDIYVTKEPCPMCAGAIFQARLAKLIFGCSDKKAGYAGSLINVLQDQRLNWQTEVVSGVMEKENRALLQEFFKSKRKK